MEKTVWTFPDLPPFLAGLTPDHLARLRTLIRAHGRVTGRAVGHGEITCLFLHAPIAVMMAVIGPDEGATLLVATPDGRGTADAARVLLTPDGSRELRWNPAIALADVLACLSVTAVIRTDRLLHSAKHGRN